MTINVTLVPARRVETAELDCVEDGADADVVLVLVALNFALFRNAVKLLGESSTGLIALSFHINNEFKLIKSMLTIPCQIGSGPLGGTG